MPSIRRPCRIDVEPFATAEEAWFWFVERSGSPTAWRVGTGRRRALAPPCLPGDVRGVVHHLFRQRRLFRDHLAVLAHYGRRRQAPDPDRRGEQRAYGLWCEAFGRLEPALRRHGIVRPAAGATALRQPVYGRSGR